MVLAGRRQAWMLSVVCRILAVGFVENVLGGSSLLLDTGLKCFAIVCCHACSRHFWDAAMKKYSAHSRNLCFLFPLVVDCCIVSKCVVLKMCLSLLHRLFRFVVYISDESSRSERIALYLLLSVV